MTLTVLFIEPSLSSYLWLYSCVSTNDYYYRSFNILTAVSMNLCTNLQSLTLNDRESDKMTQLAIPAASIFVQHVSQNPNTTPLLCEAR